MTKNQFQNKIRNFCWYVKKNTGVCPGEKYVQNSIFEFYAKHRIIPRLYMKGLILGMVIPEEYTTPLKIKRGMPE